MAAQAPSTLVFALAFAFAGGGGRVGFEICLLIGTVFWFSPIGLIGTGLEMTMFFGNGGRAGEDGLDFESVPFNVFIFCLEKERLSLYQMKL